MSQVIRRAIYILHSLTKLFYTWTTIIGFMAYIVPGIGVGLTVSFKADTILKSFLCIEYRTNLMTSAEAAAASG